MVYGLDRAMQDVRFFQEHVRSYEFELTQAIYEKFRHQLQDQSQTISRKEKQLHDLHEHITHSVNDLMLKEQRKNADKIKAMRVRRTNLDDFVVEQEDKKWEGATGNAAAHGQRDAVKASPLGRPAILGQI